MKNHLKRIAAPRTWFIDRKKNVYITRPKPGAHSMDNGMALGVVMRDVLGVASAMSEVKKILNNQEILVDGSRKKDHRLMVGLFDVISIPALKKNYRMVLDFKGRLHVIEATLEDIKLCKVTGKTAISGGKLQFNCHDGKCILAKVSANVGDTLVYDLKKKVVKEVLKLEKDMSVFLTNGKHAGSFGKLKEIRGKEATYTKDGEDIETVTQYLFVVGKSEPLISLK